MPKIKWPIAVETIDPYIVKISSPQGTGTGFLIAKSNHENIVGIATAAHVINHAYLWEQPIRIHHQSSNKLVYLRPPDRVILKKPISIKRTELYLLW